MAGPPRPVLVQNGPDPPRSVAPASAGNRLREWIPEPRSVGRRRCGSRPFALRRAAESASHGVWVVQTSDKKDVFDVFCLAMECAFIIITSCKPPYFLPFLQKKSNPPDIRWSVLKPAWSFDQLLSMKSSEPRRRRVWMVGMDSLPFVVTWAGPFLSSATAARVIWLEGDRRRQGRGGVSERGGRDCLDLIFGSLWRRRVGARRSRERRPLADGWLADKAQREVSG